MRGEPDSEMGESGSGRSEVAINASEDRERLLTLARGVKNIMGVARDRKTKERKTEQAKSECVWRA